MAVLGPSHYPTRIFWRDTMTIWQAQVRVPDGAGTRIIDTRVMAHSSHAARLLLEQQYGKMNLIGMPRLVTG